MRGAPGACDCPSAQPPPNCQQPPLPPAEAVATSTFASSWSCPDAETVSNAHGPSLSPGKSAAPVERSGAYRLRIAVRNPGTSAAIVGSDSWRRGAHEPRVPPRWSLVGHAVTFTTRDHFVDRAVAVATQ